MSKFPEGWNEQRVRRVLAHYEHQSEREAVAEDEASFEDITQTVMEVPKELVPVVRQLIAVGRKRAEPAVLGDGQKRAAPERHRVMRRKASAGIRPARRWLICPAEIHGVAYRR